MSLDRIGRFVADEIFNRINDGPTSVETEDPNPMTFSLSSQDASRGKYVLDVEHSEANFLPFERRYEITVKEIKPK